MAGTSNPIHRNHPDHLSDGHSKTLVIAAAFGRPFERAEMRPQKELVNELIGKGHLGFTGQTTANHAQLIQVTDKGKAALTAAKIKATRDKNKRSKKADAVSQARATTLSGEQAAKKIAAIEARLAAKRAA